MTLYQFKFSLHSHPRRRTWRDKDATPRQNAILFEWGLLPAHTLSRGEASRLISKVFGARAQWCGQPESHSKKGAPRPGVEKGRQHVVDVKQRKGKNQH